MPSPGTEAHDPWKPRGLGAPRARGDSSASSALSAESGGLSESDADVDRAIVHKISSSSYDRHAGGKKVRAGPATKVLRLVDDVEPRADGLAVERDASCGTASSSSHTTRSRVSMGKQRTRGLPGLPSRDDMLAAGLEQQVEGLTAATQSWTLSGACPRGS